MDISDGLDFLRDVTAVVKEQEFLEQVERIHQSGLETIRIDALARRQKSSADITAIQKFDISMEQIRFQYERIKSQLSPVSNAAMEKCLNDLEKRRSHLVFEKRRHS